MPRTNARFRPNRSPILLLIRMNEADTSASIATADWTPLTVVSRSSTTAEIETFMNDVSITKTNIAAARKIPIIRLPPPAASAACFSADNCTLRPGPCVESATRHVLEDRDHRDCGAVPGHVGAGRLRRVPAARPVRRRQGRLGSRDASRPVHRAPDLHDAPPVRLPDRAAQAPLGAPAGEADA